MSLLGAGRAAVAGERGGGAGRAGGAEGRKRDDCTAGGHVRGEWGGSGEGGARVESQRSHRGVSLQGM